MALRLAARAHHHGVARFAWPSLALSAFVLAYLGAVVVHELCVLVGALLLPIVTGVPAIQAVLAVLPVNFVYASAMVRYAGQIEASGFAVAGPVGVVLSSWLPGVFYDPSYVAGDGFVSAVLSPGSSLLARTVAMTLANTALMVLGFAVIGRAVRGATARHLRDLRGRALALLAVGVGLQVEVAARIVRDAGSTRDLETLGVLPFLLHEVMGLRREVYDLVMFQLSRWVDPVFGEAVLLGLFALLVASDVLARTARMLAGRVHALYCARPARGVPPLLRQRRLVVEAAMVGALVATLPVWDYVSPQSRFLEWDDVGVDDASGASPLVLGDGTPTVNLAVPPAPSGAPAIVLPGAPSALLPVPSVARPPAAVSPPASPPPAARPPTPLAPYVGPSSVQVAGRAGHFTYVVDGRPTEFRGMGYNVTFAGLPPAERADRLARDFAAMHEIGVNVVVGWRTTDWDEAVLDAAQAAGVGVVMPFELSDQLDYSDKAVRSRLRSDVLAWVARFRNHPAIRMWGIGNETLLHLKQPARARAFAEFYTQLVDLVRQFDPDHPVLYREAEDVYVKWLQDAWSPRGAPPGFVLGMNFYTFRLKDALAAWPSRNWDVPLVISEFAPAGLGRGERAAGYWKMWSIIRMRPELVLGAAPYVWNVEGPEPVDRLFGLTQDGRPVDSTLGTLRDMYQAAPTDEGAPVAVPSLVGLPEATALQVLRHVGLKAGGVLHRRAADLADPAAIQRYGVGSVIQQDPSPGAQLARGAPVDVVVADGALAPEVAARPIAS